MFSSSQFKTQLYRTTFFWSLLSCFLSSTALPLSLSPLPLSLSLSLVGCLQAAWALQLQRAGSCDVLLATSTAVAAGGEEEDGTGMELTRLLDEIRTQCNQTRLPGPGERQHSWGNLSNPPPSLVGPSRTGAGAAAASRTDGGALAEVRSIPTCL